MWLASSVLKWRRSSTVRDDGSESRIENESTVHEDAHKLLSAADNNNNSKSMDAPDVDESSEVVLDTPAAVGRYHLGRLFGSRLVDRITVSTTPKNKPPERFSLKLKRAESASYTGGKAPALNTTGGVLHGAEIHPSTEALARRAARSQHPSPEPAASPEQLAANGVDGRTTEAGARRFKRARIAADAVPADPSILRCPNCNEAVKPDFYFCVCGTKVRGERLVQYNDPASFESSHSRASYALHGSGIGGGMHASTQQHHHVSFVGSGTAAAEQPRRSSQLAAPFVLPTQFATPNLGHLLTGAPVRKRDRHVHFSDSDTTDISRSCTPSQDGGTKAKKHRSRRASGERVRASGVEEASQNSARGKHAPRGQAKRGRIQEVDVDPFASPTGTTDTVQAPADSSEILQQGAAVLQTQKDLLARRSGDGALSSAASPGNIDRDDIRADLRRESSSVPLVSADAALRKAKASAKQHVPPLADDLGTPLDVDKLRRRSVQLSDDVDKEAEEIQEIQRDSARRAVQAVQVEAAPKVPEVRREPTKAEMPPPPPPPPYQVKKESCDTVGSSFDPLSTSSTTPPASQPSRAQVKLEAASSDDSGAAAQKPTDTKRGHVSFDMTANVGVSIPPKEALPAQDVGKSSPFGSIALPAKPPTASSTAPSGSMFTAASMSKTGQQTSGSTALSATSNPFGVTSVGAAQGGSVTAAPSLNEATAAIGKTVTSPLSIDGETIGDKPRSPFAAPTDKANDMPSSHVFASVSQQPTTKASTQSAATSSPFGAASTVPTTGRATPQQAGGQEQKESLFAAAKPLDADAAKPTNTQPASPFGLSASSTKPFANIEQTTAAAKPKTSNISDIGFGKSLASTSSTGTATNVGSAAAMPSAAATKSPFGTATEVSKSTPFFGSIASTTTTTGGGSSTPFAAAPLPAPAAVSTKPSTFQSATMVGAATAESKAEATVPPTAAPSPFGGGPSNSFGTAGALSNSSVVFGTAGSTAANAAPSPFGGGGGGGGNSFGAVPGGEGGRGGRGRGRGSSPPRERGRGRGRVDFTGLTWTPGQQQQQQPQQQQQQQQQEQSGNEGGYSQRGRGRGGRGRGRARTF